MPLLFATPRRKVFSRRGPIKIYIQCYNEYKLAGKNHISVYCICQFRFNELNSLTVSYFVFLCFCCSFRSSEQNDDTLLGGLKV